MAALGVLPTSGKRRVLVVADPVRESAGALEWALSHAVIEHDELILLHVEQPSARRSTSFSAFLRRPPPSPTSPGRGGAGTAEGGGGPGGGEYDFLDAMRVACEAKQPKVRVQIERVEGKDKAAAILSQTKVLGADLLVIGQRRSLSSTILGCRLSATMSSKGMDTTEFLIENSKCLCVAVQKKGQNAGYLLNTRTHKNFWLLA